MADEIIRIVKDTKTYSRDTIKALLKLVQMDLYNKVELELVNTVNGYTFYNTKTNTFHYKTFKTYDEIAKYLTCLYHNKKYCTA